MTDTSSTSDNADGENESSESQESKTWEAPRSQTEFNKIIQDRVRRERDKYKDFDTFKTKASQFDELDAKSKTDLEKAQEGLTAAEQRALAAEERAKTFALRSAVVAEASKQKAVDPDAVYKLLGTGDLVFEDDGTVIGVEDAVTALLDSKPFLKQTGFTGSADGGSRGGSEPTVYTREQLRDTAFFQEHKDDIRLAQREGRIQ